MNVPLRVLYVLLAVSLTALSRGPSTPLRAMADDCVDRGAQPGRSGAAINDTSLSLRTARYQQSRIRGVVVENGKLVRRAVETGLRNWDLTEIVAGLEPNEKIVANLDRADIQPGARVRIITDAKGAEGK